MGRDGARRGVACEAGRGGVKLGGVGAWGECCRGVHGVLRVLARGACVRWVLQRGDTQVHGVRAWGGRCRGVHGVRAWGGCCRGVHGVPAWGAEGACMGCMHGVGAAEE